MLFDDGVRNNCDLPVSYLDQLGVTEIDYHFTSHYHADHIGCAEEVLDAFPLQIAAVDRGGTYSSGTFETYKTKVGTLRVTASQGDTWTLDQGTGQEVTITVLALDGNGVAGAGNENDKSLLARIDFGNFDAVIGGDLSGFDTSSYKDIETSVATAVGPLEVYKVHHHGSAYSSNTAWLDATTPLVGIISAGDGNSYGHPTLETVDRLHSAGVRLYWTEEGNGATPEPGGDFVGGNIVVEVEPGADVFSVTFSGTQIHNYTNYESGGSPSAEASASYAWSTKSNLYHYSDCRYVQNISPANLGTGSTPAADKTLHSDCPK